MTNMSPSSLLKRKGRPLHINNLKYCQCLKRRQRSVPSHRLRHHVCTGTELRINNGPQACRHHQKPAKACGIATRPRTVCESEDRSFTP